MFEQEKKRYYFIVLEAAGLASSGGSWSGLKRIGSLCSSYVSSVFFCVLVICIYQRSSGLAGSRSAYAAHIHLINSL